MNTTQQTEIALLEPTALQELGLRSEDIPKIRDLAARIDCKNAASVSEFGVDVGEHTSSYADALLDEVRNRDFDAMGGKLTQVVTLAQSTNTSALTGRRSSLPVVGPLIDKLRLKGAGFQNRFDTSKEQIDKLIGEVADTQAGLLKRNEMLEAMFGHVKGEHHQLGLHIVAGKLALQEMTRDLTAQESDVLTVAQAQDMAELRGTASALEIRVANLIALQQSALQTLPQIRAIQSTNAVLVDKFHTIKTVTIPAWKRQFVLALGLNEARNAAEMAKSIDDLTNAMLVKGADLLHKNAVSTAKSNQRLVIDVETLQHTQDMLIKTVSDVTKIQADGVKQRQAAEQQIETMREALRLAMGTKDLHNSK